jgi:hypothetical protein
VATVAWPLSNSLCDGLEAFSVLHKVIATDPPESLLPSGFTGKLKLLGGDTMMSVGPQDNDGIVNTVSMIWPAEDRTALVEADHGDIIGHYPQVEKEGSYDLLRSQPAFSRERFEQVWQSVEGFALEKESAST